MKFLIASETNEIEVMTGLGDSDCGYGFRLGGQYPVQDVRISFEGSNKHFEAKTNREGKYTISGLPAGTYKVRSDLPEGLSIYNPETEVKLYDGGCGHAFYFVEPDTRVTGKLLDSQAIPAADVLMELVPVSQDGNGLCPKSRSYVVSRSCSVRSKMFIALVLEFSRSVRSGM